jgi:peptidoglycan/LPS O-acetylase OafA/YrhL
VAGTINHISGLDGLRGTAAMLVLLAHLSNEGLHLAPGVDLGGIGKSGVYLFFVLSAFLLSTQIRVAGFGKITTWSYLHMYFEARILRIWPLFIAVCLFCLVTTWYGVPVLVPMDQAAFIETLMLQRGDHHLWTIPVEFKFYFILPVVMLVLTGLLKNHTWLCAIASIFMAALLFALTQRIADGTDPMPFLGIFLAGVAANYLAVAFKKTSEQSLNVRRGWEVAAFLCLAGYVCTIPSVYSVLSDTAYDRNAFHNAHILYCLLWSITVLGILLGTGQLRRILDSKPLVFLGKISYSLYLWHLIVVYLVGPFSHYRLESILHWYGLSKYIASWSTLIGTILIATASYYLIERPVLSWRKRHHVTQAS